MEIEREKIAEFPVFQLNCQLGAMHIVGVFTASVKMVKHESSHLSLSLSETSHFKHLPGQKRISELTALEELHHLMFVFVEEAQKDFQ